MKESNILWSRRKFIGITSGAVAATIIDPAITWSADDLDPRVAGIVAGKMGIDTHNHIEVPMNSEEAPGPVIDLSGDLLRSGLSSICMTFAVDRPTLQSPGDAYKRFKSAFSSMDNNLVKNGMNRSLNVDDLAAAFRRRQPTVIQSVEGGHFLEGKLERVEEAYTMGLRLLGLLHDNDASIPLGDVYTNPAKWGGLTTFGADVIRECNRLGILVDLAHANAETMVAALKIATHPVIISHTGLDTRLGKNQSMANMMKPRLISKDQAKIVADAGGVIGVWTHLADTPVEYAENVRALVDIIGVDHVCIGTDTKLTTSYQGTNSRNNSGIQKAERVGERTNLAWKDQKAGFYYVVVDALLKTGFSVNEIGKIGGGNFCRIFGAATNKKR